MAAEIVGIDKIVAYLRRFDFQKIKLSKGGDAVYLRRTKDGENKSDLISDLTDWANEFIDENNFRDYKLELFGTYNEQPNAKLSPVVKTTVAFHERSVVSGDYSPRSNILHNSPIDVDKYVAVATENATLKAELRRVEEKLDEILADDDDDDDEISGAEPKTVGEALQNAIIGKLDTIVDVVLTRLAMPALQTNATAINGVDDVLTEFREIHADIDADLARLLVLAKTKPDFFKMLIAQLRQII